MYVTAKSVCIYLFIPSFQDIGVFIPAMAAGMRTDFFQENPFMPARLIRETLGGLADMFGQMPGTFLTRDPVCCAFVFEWSIFAHVELLILV